MNLLAFLSDRCNMSCSYCFLSLNQGPAAVLSREGLARAIDGFRAAHPDGRVTLLGGEPSLHWELLRAGAERAGAPVTVVTNGTRLDGKRLSALAALGAQVCVSLDGDAVDHDAERKLLSGGSSLAAALEKLADADKAALRVNMVLTPRNAGRFLRNIEALRRQGFRRFSFHPDVMGDWDEAALGALRASLGGLRGWLKAVGSSVEVAHAAAYGGACAGESEELVLGADGHYYPSDGLFARPYGRLEGFRCGCARRGPDAAALARWKERARREIHAWIRDGHGRCPTEAYFRAAAEGRDARKTCESYAKADAALGEALCALAA